MPLVVVTINPVVILKGEDTIQQDSDLNRLTEMLQVIVAEELSTQEDEGGTLTPEEIEVRVRKRGPYDRGFPNLGIEVFANSNPGRKRNVQERSDRIAERVKRLSIVNSPHVCGNGTSFVWIFLGTAGFSSL